MGTEVEVKFLADGEAPLDSLAEAESLGPARLGSAVTVDEVDVYLDTASGHLAAAGWACRHRDRGRGPIVSLKGPAREGGADGVHARPEIEGPATASFDPREWPPSDARDHLMRLSEGARLVEQLRLRQRRTERPVEIGERRLGTLSLDAVTVVDTAGQVRGRLAAVELELADAEAGAVHEELTVLATALAARPGLVADARSKLEHARDFLGSA